MSGLMLYGADGCGPKTATAGTAIVQVTTRKKGCKTRIDSVVYTAGATAHTLTIMRPIGRTKLSAAALAAQAVVVLTADPGPSGNGIAANDYVVIMRPDGVPHVGVVSAWNGTTKALTLTANVPTGGFDSGADVYFYGVIGDTDPQSQAAHPQYPLADAATTTVSNATGNGVFGSARAGEPLLLHSGNATNAGTLNRANWVFSYEPSPGLGVLPDGGPGAVPDGDEG
jgi:hypothetical protein